MAEFPLVGEPGIEIAYRPGGQVHQQLGEIELRIDLVPAAGGGEAGQDGGGAAAARVAHEQGVLAVQHHPLHLAFARVVIEGHGAIGTEHVEFGPLAERVIHGLRHGMFGQQLLLPAQQFLPQFGQQRRRLRLAQGQALRTETSFACFSTANSARNKATASRAISGAVFSASMNFLRACDQQPARVMALPATTPL